MEKTTRLPPTIELLGSERLLEIASPHALRSALETSGFLDEIREQATWTIDHFEYADSEEREPSASFLITPSGSLNPFSGVGKCYALPCRLAAAERFARSAGLYADLVIVPDPLTPIFSDATLLGDEFWKQLYTELQVMRRLMPLLKAGVVTFSSPIIGFCRDHHQEFQISVRDAVNVLAREVRLEVELVGAGSEQYLVASVADWSPDLDHPLVTFAKLSAA